MSLDIRKMCMPKRIKQGLKIGLSYNYFLKTVGTLK